MATLPKPTPPTDAQQAIRALAHEFVKHYNARHIEKIVKLFTRDGLVMAPHQPPAEGMSVLQQHFFETFAQFDPRDLKVEIRRVQVSGNVAVSFGTFTANVLGPNGKRLHDCGKWMVTLRREASTWRIAGHCFNTDLPITAMSGS